MQEAGEAVQATGEAGSVLLDCNNCITENAQNLQALPKAKDRVYLLGQPLFL